MRANRTVLVGARSERVLFDESSRLLDPVRNVPRSTSKRLLNPLRKTPARALRNEYHRTDMTLELELSDTPTHSRRIVAALTIALATTLASWCATRLPGFGQQDFAVWWFAAREVLHGRNPYTNVVGISGRPAYFYPLPTAIATIPLAWIPVSIAGPLFVGVSCGLLAFVVTATAWWPLMMFLSGSMAASVVAAQFAPLQTAVLMVPSLTWLGVLKPNIGLGILAYRPSIKWALVMVAIAAATLVIRPTWPREWILTATSSPFYFSPWRAWGGGVLLAALLRWRRPEARLLAMLSVVPSAPIPYEALPLFVIPQTRWEMAARALLSDAMYVAMSNLSAQQEMAAYYERARPAIVWLLYFPALAMVLRRPNVGIVPVWLETRLKVLPGWLRGSPMNDRTA